MPRAAEMRSGRQARARLVLAVAVLAAEYAWLTIQFDGQAIADAGWANSARALALAPTFLAVILTAGWLVRAEDSGRRLSDLLDRSRSDPRAVIVHLLSFAVTIAAAKTLFQGEGASNEVLALGGLAFAVMNVVGLASWLRAWAGPAAGGLARWIGALAGSGGVLGGLAWLAGWGSRPAWPWLSSQTLQVSAGLARLHREDVEVDPERSILRVGEFAVEVAPECSGAEGLGLLVVFSVGVVIRYRKQLSWRRAAPAIAVALAVAWSFNALRIAALASIGAAGFEALALGGFHSKAGWLAFCAIALALVAHLRRESPILDPEHGRYDNPTAVYCLPFLVVLATALVTGLFAVDIDWLYALRIVTGGAVLGWSWLHLRPNFVRPGWTAIVHGLFAAVPWLWLVEPSEGVSAKLEALDDASPSLRTAWIIGRWLGAITVVPIVEELAFRGFLLRRCMTEDFSERSLRNPGIIAVAVSSLAFGWMHEAWIAGTLVGFVYAHAAHLRGRLGDAVLAHAVTNLVVILVGWTMGRPDLWL